MKSASRSLFVLLFIVSASFASAASVVDDELTKARRYEKLGDVFSAAEAYARALRLEPGNAKARKGLGKVAETAISAKLAAALELEATMRSAEAVAELNRAKELYSRVVSAGISVNPDVDVSETLTGVVGRWVERLYAEARRAQQDGLWSAAIAHFRTIETLQPDHEDSRDRLAATWMAWGKMDLEQGRYRAAADRFREAAQVPGRNRNAASRPAAAILAELGAFALDRGACRSAVKDLWAAERMAPGSVDTEISRRAESCALACLSVSIIANPDAGLESSRLDRLSAEIRSQIAVSASEFLKVRDPATATRDFCGITAERVPGGQPPSGGPRRYRGAVNVAAISVMRSPASSQNKQLRTQHGAYGETVVSYQEYQELFSGALSGSITLTDQRTDRVGPPIPVRVTGEATARWVRSPAAVVSTDDAIRGRRATGILVDPTLDRGARVEDQRREARSRLVASLIRDFAAEAARILLSIVDSEIAVADPTEIELPDELPQVGGSSASS